MNSRFRGVLSRATLAAVCITLPAAWPSSSPRAEFPPDKLENLQVLPEDIETKRLLDIMKGFSQALGVRCWFCHVGQEGQDLAEFNFVSDEKANKQIAREMIKMVMTVRKEFLPEVVRIQREVEGKTDSDPKVTCFTCHRGKAEPGD